MFWRTQVPPPTRESSAACAHLPVSDFSRLTWLSCSSWLYLGAWWRGGGGCIWVPPVRVYLGASCGGVSQCLAGGVSGCLMWGVPASRGWCIWLPHVGVYLGALWGWGCIRVPRTRVYPALAAGGERRWPAATRQVPSRLVCLLSVQQSLLEKQRVLIQQHGGRQGAEGEPGPPGGHRLRHPGQLPGPRGAWRTTSTR